MQETARQAEAEAQQQQQADEAQLAAVNADLSAAQAEAVALRAQLKAMRAARDALEHRLCSAEATLRLRAGRGSAEAHRAPSDAQMRLRAASDRGLSEAGMASDDARLQLDPSQSRLAAAAASSAGRAPANCEDICSPTQACMGRSQAGCADSPSQAASLYGTEGGPPSVEQQAEGGNQHVQQPALRETSLLSDKSASHEDRSRSTSQEGRPCRSDASRADLCRHSGAEQAAEQSCAEQSCTEQAEEPRAECPALPAQRLLTARGCPHPEGPVLLPQRPSTGAGSAGEACAEGPVLVQETHRIETRSAEVPAAQQLPGPPAELEQVEGRAAEPLHVMPSEAGEQRTVAVAAYLLSGQQHCQHGNV